MIGPNAAQQRWSRNTTLRGGVGVGGIPHDVRWYSNERFIQAFEVAKDTAQLMEKLKYDVLWMAEHHFQREGYERIPNLA